jgi:hypothetical protein
VTGAWGLLLIAGLAMAACSPPGPKSFDAMSGEEHLACAVDISAYTYLLAAGKVPEDTEMAGQAALALAWHHNAYAIPLGGDESETAGVINRKRSELIASDEPEAIAARARVCVASAIAKNAAG